jgi:hypothetical protein
MLLFFDVSTIKILLLVFVVDMGSIPDVLTLKQN